MRRTIAVFAVAVAGFVVVPQVAVGAFIERVSVDPPQDDVFSDEPAISADGRYVAFQLSPSSDIGYFKVFVRDLRSGTTRWVSVGYGDSGDPAISADGRYVAFDGVGSAGNTSGGTDVFVRDLRSRTARRVSVAGDGTQANNSSDFPAISADGRYVTFESDASNLVPGDTNHRTDVFVRDLRLGTTRRVSVAGDGTQGNKGSYTSAISADGRHVAFASGASNLVPGDTNHRTDVFVRDLRSGTTRRVSLAGDGTQANNNSSDFPAISADGRYVTFDSDASNLVPGDTNHRTDVFVRDLRSGTTRRVSLAGDGTQANNNSSDFPAISADGRYVTFDSDASNLVPGDTNHRTDVFVRDLRSGTTRRVSLAGDGTQANNSSVAPAISADGRYVAFQSGASNLVPGDTNQASDVFVRDLTARPRPPSNKFTVSGIKAEADGTITFSVRVSGPGSVDVLATAWNDNLASAAVVLKPARHRLVFARAHVPAARQGTLSVTVTPNQRGRLLVAHPRYRVVLRLWVSYTPDGGHYRTIGFFGLHLPATCTKHNTVTALNRRTVVRCT